MVTDFFFFSRGWGKKERARVPCLAQGRDAMDHVTTDLRDFFLLFDNFKELSVVHL